MKKTETELFKNMYYHLFNSISDALLYIKDNRALEILKQAQIDTEEMYISEE